MILLGCLLALALPPLGIVGVIVGVVLIVVGKRFKKINSVQSNTNET